MEVKFKRRKRPFIRNWYEKECGPAVEKMLEFKAQEWKRLEKERV
jgi:hypothetical protein